MNLYDIRLDGDLIEDALADKATQDEIKRISEDFFREQKENLIKKFFKHEVSTEIKNPEEGNISGTLGGYGDLFGFIGFFEDSDPIENVAEVLRAFVSLKSVSIEKSYNRQSNSKTNKGRFASGRMTKVFLAYSMPSLEDFDSVSAEDVGWTTSRNWVKGIERGISGLGMYANYEGKGRSKRGLQLRGKIKDPSVDRGEFTSFKPVPYMTSLMKEFNKSLEK
jgi:hypothetical protein